MNRQDLEALVTPRIAEALQAAADQLGRSEFEKMASIDSENLQAILSDGEHYVPVAIVTLACEINKSNGDTNPAHSSVTECLKGTTIRIPTVEGPPHAAPVQQPHPRRRLQRLNPSTQPAGPLYDKKTMRVLSFTANLIGFLLLGYFLGGIAISPLIGESSCIGVSTSPLVVSPCGGSFVGLVLGVIGGLGYTYYYFARKL